MLPDSNIPWPPPRMRPALEAMSTWDTWYGGDPNRLAALYGGGAVGPLAKPVQYTDGWAGKLSRWWWGTPPAEGEQRTKIHVPLASDICAASADLLFSEPPQLRAQDAATQKRVDQYMDDGMLASLQTAAEVGSALGVSTCGPCTTRPCATGHGRTPCTTTGPSPNSAGASCPP
ncbi:hypothetical protein ACQ86F_31645 [Streptomyces venezuelae ATCC 10712]